MSLESDYLVMEKGQSHIEESARPDRVRHGRCQEATFEMIPPSQGPAGADPAYPDARKSMSAGD